MSSGSWTAPARLWKPRGPGRPSWPTTSGPAVLADDRPRRFGPGFRPFGQSPPMHCRTALSLHHEPPNEGDAFRGPPCGEVGAEA